MKTTIAHFNVTGKNVTEMSRSFWKEEDYKRAFDILFGLDGMTMPIACSIISGNAKLVGESNGPDFIHVEDEDGKKSLEKAWEVACRQSSNRVAQLKSELKEMIGNLCHIVDFSHTKSDQPINCYYKIMQLESVFDVDDRLKNILKDKITETAGAMVIHPQLCHLPVACYEESVESIFKASDSDYMQARVWIYKRHWDSFQFLVNNNFVEKINNTIGLDPQITLELDNESVMLGGRNKAPSKEEEWLNKMEIIKKEHIKK